MAWLTLTTVQVGRTTQSPDGMGGLSATTVLTTLPRAALWQAGSGDRRVSQQVMQSATHVLAVQSGVYAWGSADTTIVYAGNTYSIVGIPDDVMERGELTVVGLELNK